MYIGGHYHCINNYKDLLTAIEHIKKKGGNALQIFVGKNTSTTLNQKAKLTSEESKNIKKIIKKNNMKIFIHASLTLNFSNPLIGRYKWILDNLIYDMHFGKKIGASGVVIHLGTIFAERYQIKKKENAEKEAYKNMVKSLEYVINNSPKNINILIETNAGQKNKIARYIPELAILYKMIPKKYRKNINFCIDTCHIYSAGYEISNPLEFKKYMKEFNKLIGIKYIKLIHLNDSKTLFNSGRDIHENLMQGNIFSSNIEGLKEIILFAKKHNIPLILETRDLNKYNYEINLIKKLMNK